MRELSFRKELAPDAGCLAKGQFFLWESCLQF